MQYTIHCIYVQCCGSICGLPGSVSSDQADHLHYVEERGQRLPLRQRPRPVSVLLRVLAAAAVAVGPQPLRIANNVAKVFFRFKFIFPSPVKEIFVDYVDDV